jgi:hypothetical protein
VASWWKCRDLVLVGVPGGPEILVIACDSLGGIGSKEGDVVKVPGYVVGRFAARVPLMEVMAVGAMPFVLADNLCTEMDPSGMEILQGIEDEVKQAGLESDVAITGSTEENIPTIQTGLGITVVGIVGKPENLNIGCARSGHLVACVGLPKVGHEVGLDDPEIADLPMLRKLLQLDYISELLPVGSKGLAYEANLLAQTAGLSFTPVADPPLDMTKSAGPATCVLVALPDCRAECLRTVIGQPVSVIGRLD